MKNKDKNKKVVAPGDVSGVTTNNHRAGYEKAFLHLRTLQKRGNKTICISLGYHERLTRITQVIGNDKIPLFAYLGNIPEHYFRMFEDEITKEFKEKYKALF